MTEAELLRCWSKSPKSGNPMMMMMIKEMMMEMMVVMVMVMVVLMMKTSQAIL